MNACGEKFIFQRETLNREDWKGKEKIVSQVILNLRTLKFTTLIELLVIKNRIQTKYITWLSLHGLAKIGTLQELRMRINKFQLYPSLTKKLSYKCDALRDLVLFAQFKKSEKHPWRSVNFSKVAGFSLQHAHAPQMKSLLVPV